SPHAVDAGKSLEKRESVDHRWPPAGMIADSRYESTGCQQQLYQTKRNPNCMVRPSSAVVIVPTVALEMLLSGVPKFAWFSRLKISQRNSTRALLIGNRLLVERSTR